MGGEQWPKFSPSGRRSPPLDHASSRRRRHRSFRCGKLFWVAVAVSVLAIIVLLVNQRRKHHSPDGTSGLRLTASDTDTDSSAFIDPEKASKESTEATDIAARAAAELVDTLDAAREAADGLRRVAAAAAHKKRVADRAAAVAATRAKKQGGNNGEATAIASVRERKVKLKDGSEASFSVFGRSDEDISVFVLPYDTKTKTFTLIEEYHPGPDRKMVGLVAGMFEPKHGGSPEKAALWELSEEARLKLGEESGGGGSNGSRLVQLAPYAKGGFSQDKYSSAHFIPYLALDCVDDGRPRARDKEEDITVHGAVGADKLREMLRDGSVNIPSTAFALMGLNWLEEHDLL